MPTTTTASGVFSRFRRQTQQENELGVEAIPDRIPSPTYKSALLRGEHRRDSSLRSLSSSVSDLRRSVSLRSHQSQLSAGARPQHSSSSLLQSPNLDPPGSPTPPSPPRHRSKLSFSTRPFSRSLKSSEALPLFDDVEEVPEVPPLTAVDHKKPFSMLTVAPFNRPERQFQASQVSLPQTVPPSSHGGDPGFGSPPPPPSSHGQTSQSIYQQIQETAAKRMSTIQYIKRIHEGDVFFFNTFYVSQGGLSGMPSFSSHKMGRRATSYFHLGHSLCIILDMKSTTPIEYLRPLTALLQEFETYQSLAGVDGTGSLSRRGMGAMLKSGMGLGKGGKSYRRASAATDTFTEPTSLTTTTSTTDLPSPGYAHEFSYLLTPQLPFDPDFGTAFSTLCDVLTELYAMLLNLISTPEACGIAVAEAFSKADKSIRKILVANVVKEFEEHSRGGAKAEIAGLSKLVLGGLM